MREGLPRSAGAPTLATLRRALQPQLLPSFPVYRPHPNLGRLQGGGKDSGDTEMDKDKIKTLLSKQAVKRDLKIEFKTSGIFCSVCGRKIECRYSLRFLECRIRCSLMVP